MQLPEYLVYLDAQRKPYLKQKCCYTVQDEQAVFDTPHKAYRRLCELTNMDAAAEEYVYVLAMDTKNRPMGLFELAHGTATCSVSNPRELFIRLLLCGATGFVIAHNHPSGVATPSKSDHENFQMIHQMATMMGICMNDYLVIGNNNYFSFREQSLMKD